MSQHTIKGYITYQKYDWSDKPFINFCPWKPAEDNQTVVIREHQFDVEVPDDFNPVPQMIAGLEEKKRLARLALAADLAKLDEEISKLQAIEHTA